MTRAAVAGVRSAGTIAELCAGTCLEYEAGPCGHADPPPEGNCSGVVFAGGCDDTDGFFCGLLDSVVRRARMHAGYTRRGTRMRTRYLARARASAPALAPKHPRARALEPAHPFLSCRVASQVTSCADLRGTQVPGTPEDCANGLPEWARLNSLSPEQFCLVVGKQARCARRPARLQARAHHACRRSSRALLARRGADARRSRRRLQWGARAVRAAARPRQQDDRGAVRRDVRAPRPRRCRRGGARTAAVRAARRSDAAFRCASYGVGPCGGPGEVRCEEAPAECAVCYNFEYCLTAPDAVSRGSPVPT